MIYICIKGIISSKKQEKIIIIAFLSTGMFKLLLSSSYLHQEPSFYILLALCINTLYNKNLKEQLPEK